MLIVYLSTPYSDPDPAVKAKRYEEAVFYAAKLHDMGYVVISPVIDGVPVSRYAGVEETWEVWEKICKTKLQVCDQLFYVETEGTEKSTGMKAELRFAHQMNKPIIFIHWDEQGKEMVMHDPYHGSHIWHRFTLTEDHHKLLNATHWEWDDHVYDGAPRMDYDYPYTVPVVDIKRPYGNKWAVDYGIGEILKAKFKLDKEECKVYTKEQKTYFRKLHQEMLTVMRIGTYTGKFDVGDYICYDEFADRHWFKTM